MDRKLSRVLPFRYELCDALHVLCLPAAQAAGAKLIDSGRGQLLRGTGKAK
jgi:hypothetical protein